MHTQTLTLIQNHNTSQQWGRLLSALRLNLFPFNTLPCLLRPLCEPKKWASSGNKTIRAWVIIVHWLCTRTAVLQISHESLSVSHAAFVKSSRENIYRSSVALVCGDWRLAVTWRWSNVACIAIDIAVSADGDLFQSRLLDILSDSSDYTTWHGNTRTPKHIFRTIRLQGFPVWHRHLFLNMNADKCPFVVTI